MATDEKSSDKLRPYEWQHAISASNLDPVTPGVLWALSLYINKRTGYAFPSLRTLSRASGYSLDAVRRHIKIALSSGWIATDNAGLEGQKWRRSAYIPIIPEGAPRRLETKRKYKGVLTGSTPSTQQGVLPQPQGVLPQPQGVLPQPQNTPLEIAQEPAPVVACSDSLAVPNNSRTIEEQEIYCAIASHERANSSQNYPQRGDPEGEVKGEPQQGGDPAHCLDNDLAPERGGVVPPCQEVKGQISASSRSRPEVNGTGFAGSANFERWWRSLPSNAKKNKKRARQAWKRQRLDSRADELIADVQKRMAQDRQWIDGFNPQAVAYLEGERWTDEIDRSSPGQRRAQPAPKPRKYFTAPPRQSRTRGEL